jgi:hypothetical protein
MVPNHRRPLQIGIYAVRVCQKTGIRPHVQFVIAKNSRKAPASSFSDSRAGLNKAGLKKGCLESERKQKPACFLAADDPGVMVAWCAIAVYAGLNCVSTIGYG